MNLRPHHHWLGMAGEVDEVGGDVGGVVDGGDVVGGELDKMVDWSIVHSRQSIHQSTNQ